MELSESQQLAYLVESLTTSGTQELDKPNLKKLKSMCKKSNVHIDHAFHLLLTQLEKDHSEIRLAALFVVDELFQRSHVFRELLLENFHTFLELTAETNFDLPLPEPRNVAKEVVKKSLKCVHAWHEKFGPAYKKLVLGYNFLKGTKKIQLVNADEVQTQIQRNAMEERKRRKDESRKKKLDKVLKDIYTSIPEIKNCIAELEACFSLLVPNFKDEVDSKQCTTDNLSKEYHDELRESGLISHDFSIELDLSKDIFELIRVKEDKDNEAILENLRDREKVLKNLYFPKVKQWLANMGMCGAPSQILKQVIDLKVTITKSLEKSKDLIITSPAQTANHADMDSDESSDDDFVEVSEKPRSLPTSGLLSNSHSDKKRNSGEYCMAKKELLSTDVNIWKPLRPDDNLDDPASYSRALAVQKQEIEKVRSRSEDSVTPKFVKLHPKRSIPKTENKAITGSDASKKNIIDAAPVVPFGPDLLEWDSEKKQELRESLSMGSAKEFDIGHRFWSGDTASRGEDGVSDAALTALTTRSIAFPGEFEPVKWSCRAQLPNGRLCPRKDRFKCPFHGPIIARDCDGIPMDQTKQVDQSQPTTSSTPDWQDPALLRELKCITGIDLKMPTKKQKQKKQKKKQYEHLTNVRNQKDTSRFRLEKKVLDPKSRKRVSETLDALDAKRNFQKFGNNFNYALN